MPWPTGAGFAARHNKKLSGEAATKAAHVASAMVEKGVPEGIAIATGNKIGNRARAKHLKRRGAISARAAEKHGV
jgi:hypothetical protein